MTIGVVAAGLPRAAGKVVVVGVGEGVDAGGTSALRSSVATLPLSVTGT
jgi:hypothetical protein